jgi:hypothetical protein
MRHRSAARNRYERKENEMSKRLFTTIWLAVVLAPVGVTSTAMAGPQLADPNNATPTSPGACNMLHTSDIGLNGMMNDRHVFDIMIPLVEASFGAGCTP